MLASFEAGRQGFLKFTDKNYKTTNFMDLSLLSEGFTQKDLNDLETVTRLWSEAKTDRDTAQSYIKAYDELR